MVFCFSCFNFFRTRFRLSISSQSGTTPGPTNEPEAPFLPKPRYVFTMDDAMEDPSWAIPADILARRAQDRLRALGVVS
ncbi:unnamed protein product [Caenorhabditis auriculariae]|uniref:Uncharacterized protein n=1 Tax=Caenorhabditis auriculariae TaxID=2777116 RepID=A0A8S1HY37_9PELO|nr:unnamed protein product [Caenorhabditis auriculariae]